MSSSAPLAETPAERAERYAELNRMAIADYTVEGMTPEEVYIQDQRADAAWVRS